jgi:hypothetical protein
LFCVFLCSLQGIPGGHLFGVSLRARTSISIGGYSVLGCGTSGEGARGEGNDYGGVLAVG